MQLIKLVFDLSVFTFKGTTETTTNIQLGSSTAVRFIEKKTQAQLNRFFKVKAHTTAEDISPSEHHMFNQSVLSDQIALH